MTHVLIYEVRINTTGYYLKSSNPATALRKAMQLYLGDKRVNKYGEKLGSLRRIRINRMIPNKIKIPEAYTAVLIKRIDEVPATAIEIQENGHR